MARWQRDPRARRRLAYLLVAAEVLAILVNFYSVFAAYLRQVNIRLAPGGGERLIGETGMWVIVVVATVLCLVAAVYAGHRYIQGRRWARMAFLTANIVLVGLGGLWFLKNRLGSPVPNMYAAAMGMLIPIVTLFPLLWPLLSFRPIPAPESVGHAQ